MAEKKTNVELARNALAQLPETADSYEILTAVHQRLELERDIDISKQVTDSRKEGEKAAPSSWWSDSLGCLAPMLLIPAFFISMPLLFALGDWLFSPPPRTTATGKIAELVLVNGSNTSALLGRPCRVLIDHLLIESTEVQVTVIPNEAVVQLVLEKDN